MSKYSITLTKQEIELAILAYVNRGVTINGRRELDEPSLSFLNKDGDIGYFSCIVEVEPPKPDKEAL